MMPIFNLGVTRKSEQLTRLMFQIDRLVLAMERHTELKQFAGKHPAALKKSVDDLKKARKYIYGSIRELNFRPGKEPRPLYFW